MYYVIEFEEYWYIDTIDGKLISFESLREAKVYVNNRLNDSDRNITKCKIVSDLDQESNDDKKEQFIEVAAAAKKIINSISCGIDGGTFAGEYVILRRSESIRNKSRMNPKAFESAKNIIRRMLDRLDFPIG